MCYVSVDCMRESLQLKCWQCCNIRSVLSHRGSSWRLDVDDLRISWRSTVLHRITIRRHFGEGGILTSDKQWVKFSQSASIIRFCRTCVHVQIIYIYTYTVYPGVLLGLIKVVYQVDQVMHRCLHSYTGSVWYGSVFTQGELMARGARRTKPFGPQPKRSIVLWLYCTRNRQKLIFL